MLDKERESNRLLKKLGQWGSLTCHICNKPISRIDIRRLEFERLSEKKYIHSKCFASCIPTIN